MNAEEKFVVPSTQFVENPEGYELKVSLPGIGKEDAELHVEGRTLVLKAHSKYQNPAGFKQVAGEFEYEILDSKEDTSGQAGDSAIVTVRIRTYDFASEYLKTWTEYLEKSDPEQFDEAELYEDLFRNLSSLRKKSISLLSN